MGRVVKTGRAASAPKITTSVQMVCHGDVGRATQTHRGREDHHAREHLPSTANTTAPVTEEHGGTEEVVGAVFVVGTIGGDTDRVLVDFEKRTSRNEEPEERRKAIRDGKSFSKSRSLSSTGTSAQGGAFSAISATTHRGEDASRGIEEEWGIPLPTDEDRENHKGLPCTYGVTRATRGVGGLAGDRCPSQRGAGLPADSVGTGPIGGSESVRGTCSARRGLREELQR